MTTAALAVRQNRPVRLVPEGDRSELRLERLRLRAQERQQAIELVKILASNPVLELIAGWAFLAYTRNVPSDSFWGNLGEFVTDTAGAAAITGAVTMQQASPMMPYLAQMMQGTVTPENMAGLASLLAFIPK